MCHDHVLTLPRLKRMGFSFLLRTPHGASRVPSLRTAIDRAPWHRRRHYSAALLKHQGAGRANPPAHIPAGVVIGVSPIPAARAAEGLPLAPANGPAATATLARVGGRHPFDGHARQRRLVPDFCFSE